VGHEAVTAKPIDEVVYRRHFLAGRRADGEQFAQQRESAGRGLFDGR
jgi:hypothetical protein